jgi:hypothetical protein
MSVVITSWLLVLVVSAAHNPDCVGSMSSLNNIQALEKFPVYCAGVPLRAEMTEHEATNGRPNVPLVSIAPSTVQRTGAWCDYLVDSDVFYFHAASYDRPVWTSFDTRGSTTPWTSSHPIEIHWRASSQVRKRSRRVQATGFRRNMHPNLDQHAIARRAFVLWCEKRRWQTDMAGKRVIQYSVLHMNA